MESLKVRLEKGIAEFNRYRSPEATAKLVSFRNKFFEVEFTGHFCRTCGFYDYFGDFLIVLEDNGLKTMMEKVEEFDGGASVIFKQSD